MSNSVTLTFAELLWLSLAPATLTGIVGVLAGFVGPWFLESRKQVAERKKKRAEKLEELVAAVYEHEHWLSRVKNVRVFGEVGEIPVSPMSKMRAIAATYFPNKFNTKIVEVNAAADAYELWTFEGAQKRLKGDIADLKAGGPEAYKAYATSRNALVTELLEYGRQEFSVGHGKRKRSQLRFASVGRHN